MSKKNQIPIGISARHVHLSVQHIEQLFGQNSSLTHDFDLSQPGQFAAVERVTLKTVKGEIKQVRVLGPARSETQVEISKTDSFLLGIQPPIRLSGDIKGSLGLTLVGPYGEVHLEEGVIIAKNHIHMHPNDALEMNVQDGDVVDVHVNSERPITFHDVVIRVCESFALDMHVDTDEGNAANLAKGAYGSIVRKCGAVE